MDQISSRILYALSAAENLVVYGADVANAFGEAPPPKQGFFIRPDKAFHDWWLHKNRAPIPKGYVIPILAAMEGHPESPRLWEKYADKIIRNLGLKPTIHEPCLYSGVVDGERVLFKRQVDDFEIATSSERIANILFDAIDDLLTFPIKRMGLVTMFNGIDVLQNRDYIKISVQTYIERFLEKHLNSWMAMSQTSEYPTPLPHRPKMMQDILNTEGSSDEKAQTDLAK